ncbi:MAG: amino acid-binding protein, partial [Proteobacteria bacterium]|nr:amino acid-binding protein [Pseudomonadota bacterium]
MLEKNVTKVVQDMVLNGPIEAKELCVRIGKPYSTLLREINPFDSRAKLGVETLLDIIRVTGNNEPLKFMARELGFGLVPLPKSRRTSAYDLRPEAG